MHTSYAARHSCSRAFAFMVGLLVAVAVVGPAAANDSIEAYVKASVNASAILPNPLLSIDQNRTTVVDHVVAACGDALLSAGAGLAKEQLATLLTGLRSANFLAATMAASLDGLSTMLA